MASTESAFTMYKSALRSAQKVLSAAEFDEVYIKHVTFYGMIYINSVNFYGRQYVSVAGCFHCGPYLRTIITISENNNSYN